jgi:hypothetical protein
MFSSAINSFRRPHGGGFEILHHFGQRVVDPEEFTCKEMIGFIALFIDIDTVGMDHVIDTRMGELCELRILECHREIIVECAFPMRYMMLLMMFIEPSEDIVHRLFPYPASRP